MAKVLPEHGYGQDQDIAYETIHFILILTGGSACFLVLLIIAGLACHPVSRSSLDRLSFRIMVCALLANLTYSISTALMDRFPGEDTCPVMLWLANTSLLLSAFLFFCVGLNLQLVMIHGIQGQKMEKYYIACSFILAVAISIPPLATKNYRISQSGHCRRVNLIYQLTTRHLWIVLTILGEMVTFTSILIHLMRLKVFDASPPPTRTCQSILRPYRKPLGPTQYRTIVLRIAMYPLASFVILSIATCGSVYVSARGGQYVSSKVHTIFVMTMVAYGTRPFVYACMALFDPSLIRAIKALYRHYYYCKPGDTITTASDIPPLVRESQLERGETNTDSDSEERDLELEVFTRQI